MNWDPQWLMREIGYEFTSLELLDEALTHRSFVNESVREVDNQRLEFLGDSVLNLIVATALFETFPEAHEGQLSTMLSQIVCEPALAARATEIHLGDLVHMGRGEELSGGRARPSLLADAFEALLGAIYLDGGIDASRGVILKLLGNHIASCEVGDHAPTDFKSRLQKLVQSAKLNAPTYRIAGEDGPDHEKTFTVEVVVDGDAVASGMGRSKKEAEQRAAQNALVSLGDT